MTVSQLIGTVQTGIAAGTAMGIAGMVMPRRRPRKRMRLRKPKIMKRKMRMKYPRFF